MGILSFLSGKSKEKDKTAHLAKMRLNQILVDKNNDKNPYLNFLEDEILKLMSKYANINTENVESSSYGDKLDLSAEMNNGMDKEEAKGLFERFFGGNKKSTSAQKAKDRLSILMKASNFKYSNELKKDVEELIKKHSNNNNYQVDVSLRLRDEKDFLALELTMPNLNK